MAERDGPSGEQAGGRRRGEDPMSADRRTLLIAAVAMVVLVAVGAASAAVFTRSACAMLEPEQVPAGTVGTDVAAVLDEALADLEPREVEQVVEGLQSLVSGQAVATGLGGEGQLVGAADVGPAHAIAALPDGLLARGQRLTALTAIEPDAPAVELGEDATVVGDGEQLYALALVNELTGQVDGILPLDAGLDEGECFDTAQVGVPLTFHLDAGDGQLLLLRVDDDGDDPEVQLRDVDGEVWTEPVELGAGPPGLLAERLAGHLDDEVVVTARRSQADDPAPALQARDRADGQLRWEVSAEALDQHAPAGEEALEVEVVDVVDGLVLVTLSREERAPVLLVAVSAQDGQSVWTSDLDAEGPPRPAGAIGGDVVLVAPRSVVDADADERTFELVRVATDDGSVRTLHGASGTRAAASVLGAQVVFAVDDAVARIDPDGQQHAVSTVAPVVDVRSVGGQVALLVRSPEGGAIVWARL